MTGFSAWLNDAALTVFTISAALFVVLNAGAVALVALTRDRRLVNRWTARWLAVNVLLIGAGVGVPVAAKVVRLTIDALAATKAMKSPPQDTELEARPR